MSVLGRPYPEVINEPLIVQLPLQRKAITPPEEPSHALGLIVTPEFTVRVLKFGI